METTILIYFIIINLITFIVWGYDKWQAVRNGNASKNASNNASKNAGSHATHTTKTRSEKSPTHHTRIAEKHLLYLVIAGGGLGALLGMQVFRHKTKKSSFLWKVMSILVVYLALIAWILVGRS